MSLTFTNNQERENYLSKRGKVILSACPGSGKTTVLAYKLKSIINDVRVKHGQHAGVLCLSFTNVATDEILEKYKLFHDESFPPPSEVSTINSFVNTFITLPFYRAICRNNIRPQILEDDELDKTLIRHINYRTYRLKNVPIYRIYPPRKFKFDKSGNLTTQHNLNPSDERVFLRYAAELKRLQTSLGIFKNDQSVFVAHKILDRIPRLGKYIVNRFPYIFVDEAQDTSEEQFSLLQKLYDFGLDGLEVIGDYYQSIYEWRDARPDIFFNLGDNDDWQKCELNECRRSTQPIVDTYSIIRAASDTSLRSSIGMGVVENPVQVILYDAQQPNNAIRLYERISDGYENKKILVRGKKFLKKLNGTSTSQLPWKSDFPMEVIFAYQDLKKGKIKKAINDVRSVFVRIKNPDMSYVDRQTLIKELKSKHQLNSHLLLTLKNMPPIQLPLEEWTSEAENYFQHSFELDTLSFGLKQKSWTKKYSTRTDSILGFVERPIATEVSTIHGVKGMTLESTLVLFDSRSSNNSLTFNDLTGATGLPTETQRLLYVAMSRAEHLLVLGIPSTTCNIAQAKELLGQHIPVHES